MWRGGGGGCGLAGAGQGPEPPPLGVTEQCPGDAIMGGVSMQTRTPIPPSQEVRKSVVCPCQGRDPASGHPKAQRPPLGRLHTVCLTPLANGEGRCPAPCGLDTEQ